MIRWVVFLVVAALAESLAGPTTVQVGQLPDKTPIFEPYPSVVFLKLGLVLIAAGMFAYDVSRLFRHR